VLIVPYRYTIVTRDKENGLICFVFGLNGADSVYGRGIRFGFGMARAAIVDLWGRFTLADPSGVIRHPLNQLLDAARTRSGRIWPLRAGSAVYSAHGLKTPHTAAECRLNLVDGGHCATAASWWTRICRKRWPAHPPRSESPGAVSELTAHCISMGGAFDAKQFLDGYYDEHCYYNCPMDSSPANDPYQLDQFGRACGATGHAWPWWQATARKFL
jgi:hypothetical protein